MALTIRMRQQGRRNRLFYRMVVTEGRTRRDGKYLECIGWYSPSEQDEERALLVKPDRLQHWLDMGAEISEKAESLAKQKAPAVIKAFKEKALKKQAALTAKRKARRRAAAEAKK